VPVVLLVDGLLRVRSLPVVDAFGCQVSILGGTSNRGLNASSDSGNILPLFVSDHLRDTRSTTSRDVGIISFLGDGSPFVLSGQGPGVSSLPGRPVFGSSHGTGTRSTTLSRDVGIISRDHVSGTRSSTILGEVSHGKGTRSSTLLGGVKRSRGKGTRSSTLLGGVERSHGTGTRSSTSRFLGVISSLGLGVGSISSPANSDHLTGTRSTTSRDAGSSGSQGLGISRHRGGLGFGSSSVPGVSGSHLTGTRSASSRVLGLISSSHPGISRHRGHSSQVDGVGNSGHGDGDSDLREHEVLFFN